jgi:hypothetical protein
VLMEHYDCSLRSYIEQTSPERYSDVGSLDKCVVVVLSTVGMKQSSGSHTAGSADSKRHGVSNSIFE